MGDPTSNCANHGTTLRNKFELEKHDLSYADFPPEVVKNLPNMAASPSNHSQKQRVGSKAMEMEEIVRHMSNLPSFLERGKPIQDRALNFGVMDWGRLEKWQYQHHKQGLVRSNKYLPSSSNSSLLFSTDGSSPHSSRGQSSSTAPLKPHHVTLQSHLNISPKEIFTPFVKSCSGKLDEFRDFEDVRIDHCSEKKTTNLLETKPRGCKMNDLFPQNLPESKSSNDMRICQAASSSSSKGKMKIQDELAKELGNFQDPSCRACDRDHFERHKTVVLLLPRDAPGNSQTNDEKSGTKHRSFSEDIHSDLSDDVPRSFQLQTEVVNRKNSLNEANSERNLSSPCRSKTPVEKKSTVSSKNSDFEMGAIAASKQRSTSPYRRFSFSMSTKSAAPTSATKRAESPPVSRKSTKDNTSVSHRVHSSPLRRLLDPLFPSKATYSCQYADLSLEDSKIKAKVKLDLRSLKEVGVDDSHRNKMDVSSPTMQALFQTVVKNGHPLFTFAVDNNSGILAATVRSLSGKEDSNGWIYSFFTIREVKKKNGGWLSQGIKGKGHGYVPNIAAQMKVSNPSISNCSTREFILFSVDPSQLKHQISDVQPQDELAAIVVQFLRKADEEENQDRFSTTVILPGGHHSIPSKGEPSPLIERWRSGGACDCGGWDTGCRLRTLTDQVQSSRTLNSPDVHIIPGQFELFFQGEVLNERPFFSLSPLKEGIFSVRYNSTLSLLHAFSICISVMECRKSCQHTELRTYVAKQVDDDEAPVTYASFSPLSPVGRV